MQLYGQISKVEPQDDGTIKVYGIASTESTDSAGEIVRAAAVRDAIPDYLKFPALREMHQLSAAGSTLEAEVGDDNVTRIVAHVVDEAAIRKVQKQVYRGFSIGGKVLARDPDNKKIITGLKLTEISLVDRPACPDAVIDLWKADTDPDNGGADGAQGEGDNMGAEANTVEKREFNTKERRQDARSGAAMPDGSFPIENKQDLRNAVRAFGRAKNKAAAKRHIIARARALGATDLLPDDWKGSAKKADGAQDDGENMNPESSEAVGSGDPDDTKNASDQTDQQDEGKEGEGEQADAAKGSTADPINPSKTGDVMGDGDTGTAAPTTPAAPVAGARVSQTYPPGDSKGAGTAKVPNPAEAGNDGQDKLNPSDTPVVETSTPAAATDGTDQRTRRQAEKSDNADDNKADAGESENEDQANKGEGADASDNAAQDEPVDPVAKAREAAAAAMKTVKAAKAALDRRDGIASVPAPLVEGMELRKGLYSVGCLGSILCEVAYLVRDTQFEAEMEGDESPVPEKLRTALRALADAYRSMSDEELTELLSTIDPAATAKLALAESGGDLTKVLTETIEPDALMKALNLDIGGEKLTKAEERIATLEAERDVLVKTVSDLSEGMEELGKRVEQLAAEPLPPKTLGKAADPAVLTSVSKEDDTTGTAKAATVAAEEVLSPDAINKMLGALPEEERTMLILKAALSKPVAVTR